MIDEELARITELFPAVNLSVLRKVPIWIEWDHVIPKDVRAFATYCNEDSRPALRLQGVDEPQGRVRGRAVPEDGV